ncbi:MAG: SPFH domain-containing protein [Sandaracinaceae bacterium]
MTEERRSKKTDLVLSNGEYAFTQDTTTGVVKVLTGPTVVNVTGQEYPVLYGTSSARFEAVELEDAAQKSPMAPQGFYIELHNPPATESGAQPIEGSKEIAPSLLMGRRMNIPGPATFSLWPRQVAKVIEGHHLRSNQYLLGRVYDEEAAKANWQKAVLKIASGAVLDGDTDGPQGTISELTEEDLSVGKLFVIKGTEVSFYIPPTGVEVVPDESGNFVREALTLERLQYCILVDETGDKDYQRGPKVVFPKPTQRFFTDRKANTTVFRATELNKKQGILVKVIAGYEEAGRTYREGEELFITGADTPLYIPRPEHSLVRYDGSAKHFATAVPEGEARYVMDRETGVIRTVRGPTMLLPDPRQEVIVRRVLSERECGLLYPGNEEALAYNRALLALVSRTPSTRNAVSEGEVRRGGKKLRKPGHTGYADVSTVHSSIAGPVADEWMRAATFSEPRALTLMTKYAGAPAVHVWSGYAVMVVSKSGDRRVEVGPKALLLGYDETLAVLRVSTGLPKSVAAREEVSYLPIRDQRIRDRTNVRTRDHVQVAFELAISVRFEGDPLERWFEVDDYVGLAVSWVRRRAREAAGAVTIDALHADPTAIVREAVLGEADEGRFFEANGMRITDVQLTSVVITDPAVREMFEAARTNAIASAVELEQAEARLEAERRTLALERQRLVALADKDRFETELAHEKIARDAGLSTARADRTLLELHKKLEEQEATDLVADARQNHALSRQQRAVDVASANQRAEVELELTKLRASTDAAVARFTAAQGPLAEAITMLGNQQVLATVAEAVSAQRLFGGKNVHQVVGSLFTGTRLAGVFAKIERGSVRAVDAEE